MKWIALTALCLGLCTATAANAFTTPSDFTGIDQIASGAPVVDSGVTQVALLQAVPQTGEPNVADVVNNPTDTSSVDQTGYSQAAHVLQTGEGDISRVTQSGFMETAYVTQSGAGDISEITQSGSFQYARVEQYGSGDFSSITQMGQGNQAFVSQFSDGARSVITQNGVGNIATVRQ
jgi:hypothetical protein